MSLTIPEILHTLRVQLAQRGHGLSIKTLSLAFEVNAKDHSFFVLDDLESILHKCGLFLKRQDLSKLFRYFDKDNTGKISFNDFLVGLQGELPQRRLDIVKKAFAKLDKDGSGVVDIKDIHGVYNASKHPLVLSGQKTEKQVLTEFIDSWKGTETKTADGVCTEDDFVAYYKPVSASIVDDTYFVEMMEKCWGIKESGWDGSDVSADVLSQLQSVLREKVRQKAKGNEADALKRAFKHFDPDETGHVDMTNFLFALERFGMVLDAKAANALFLQFDKQHADRLDYKEFVRILYQSDPLSASFKATAAASSSVRDEVKKPAVPAVASLSTKKL